jgi:hypothetical protein
MAHGQIDPARLQGEALRRWYLRSPTEIDEERRSAADRAYSAFFSDPNSAPALEPAQRGDQRNSSPDARLVWNASGENRWRAGRTPPGQSIAAQPADAGRYQLAAAASPRGFWDYWGVPGCANCHGYRPGTLPPVGGHSPFPPSYSPRSGNSDGSSTPQPRREERRQCEAQERDDRGICSQQPTEPAKAVCNASATERRVHCDATGEIGEPDLYTARRKSGRRWP